MIIVRENSEVVIKFTQMYVICILYLVGGNNKYQPINQPLLLMITPIIGWLNSLYNLVGGWATPLKNMSSSVGMMKFPIYGKIKFMFQTTKKYMC